jgi:voltage-gated potassium channel
MYFAEHSAQPDKFGSIPQSLYWAAITLTTVGYGDVSPVTWVGQMIAVMTAFMGVCTVALLTGIVANAFANQLARRRAIFESELRQALKDGELHEDEIARLEQMKKAFNLSDNQAQSILANVEMENKAPPTDAQNKTAP